MLPLKATYNPKVAAQQLADMWERDPSTHCIGSASRNADGRPCVRRDAASCCIYGGFEYMGCSPLGLQQHFDKLGYTDNVSGFNDIQPLPVIIATLRDYADKRDS